jgi:hypothetical protein
VGAVCAQGRLAARRGRRRIMVTGTHRRRRPPPDSVTDGFPPGPVRVPLAANPRIRSTSKPS